MKARTDQTKSCFNLRRRIACESRRIRRSLSPGFGDTFEKCSWYRDAFTENRVIVKGARGTFHREFGADVPVETTRREKAPRSATPSHNP